MKNDVIALVGAGKGGRAILETLLNIQGIEIKIVFDINPQAPGIAFAKYHGVPCSHNPQFAEVAGNSQIDLILEVTGRDDVFQKLNQIKHPSTNLMGASGTKIIFHLLDAQHQTTIALQHLKDNLEDLVQQRTNQLEIANKELEHRIEEHRLLVDQLQQINNEKTKYLLKATHQLKAPFAAIQSYVDLILGGYAGEMSNQTENIMKKIKIRCEFLARSISEMLQLANLKSCVRDNLRMRSENAVSLVFAVIDSCRIIAQQRKIEIFFHPSEKKIPLFCNSEQMSILLSVLLENALNYSYHDSKIEIVATRSGDTFKISIKDFGIGIATASIPKIFNEYYRSNEAVNHNENGSGLGLSIAQEIANIHNLKIEVQSKLGEGSMFSIIGRCPDGNLVLEGK